MYKHDYSRQFASVVALSVLAALGSQAAQAQATAFNPNGTAAQLGPLSAMTDPFNTPNDQGFLPSPTTANVGPAGIINKVTFTAQGAPLSNTGFEAPISNGMSTNFAAGTHLLTTFDGQNLNPTGPLQINFAQGVTAFGISAQDDVSDSETFSFTVFLNGSTIPLAQNQFTLGPFANFIGSGKAVFLGAQATGVNVITRVDISSSSVASNGHTGDSNDFIVGPASITAPVPEATTSVGFGAGVLLLAGPILGARKRRGVRASQATA